MEYYLMEPPFKAKSFYEMTKREAQIHYDWFIEKIPFRIDQLKRFYSEIAQEPAEVLDYSPESLVKLCGWYMKNAEIEEKTMLELQKEIVRTPEIARENILKQQISAGWMAVAEDIAIYFAECFVKAHETVKWNLTTRPKNYIYVNRPVLIGFKYNAEMSPVDLVKVLAARLLCEEIDENGLLNSYKIWVQDVAD